MLQPGGQYKLYPLHTNAGGTANGLELDCTDVSDGSYTVLTLQVVGVGVATITFEGTLDLVTWAAIPGVYQTDQSITTTATADGIYRVPVTGLIKVRARISAFTSGAIYVYGIMSSTGDVGVKTGGGGVSDHALLSHLDYASSGHTGFEASGTAAGAISTHVGLSDPHTQYLLESDFVPPGSDTQVLFNDGGAWGTDTGLTYAKATDRLSVTGGLVAPSMRPASDGTSALGWFDAAGTQFFYGDTTNRRLGIGATPGNNSALTIAASGANIVGGIGVGMYVTSTAQCRVGINSGNSEGNAGFSLYASGVKKWSIAHYKFYGTGHDFSFYNEALASDAFFIQGSSNYMSVGGNTSPTALLDINPATTTRASLRIRAGTAPTTPNDGDLWNDGNAYAIRVNGTNAVNTDGGLSVWMQSSITARNVGRLLWQYTDKTDATRVSEGSLTAYYQSTERKAMRWSADSGGPTLGFYNGAPVAKAAAYTQSYSTADRTLSAYTADNESGAYTGIDNAQAGTVYATLTDLNALRTAYEILRAFVEDIAGVVNSHTDDLQALNLVG